MFGFVPLSTDRCVRVARPTGSSALPEQQRVATGVDSDARATSEDTRRAKRQRQSGAGQSSGDTQRSQTDLERRSKLAPAWASPKDCTQQELKALSAHLVKLLHQEPKILNLGWFKERCSQSFNQFLQGREWQLWFEDEVAKVRGPKIDKTPKLRFSKGDRVVCNMGQMGWVAGAVARLNEPNPEQRGQVLPYVVLLDPPQRRWISVPNDLPGTCRAEVCFEDSARGEPFLIDVAQPTAQPLPPLRFALNTRVTCLTAGPDGKGRLVWEAGTVKATWYRARPRSNEVPYSVGLDSGRKVCAHKDVHGLIRSLTLQPAGQYKTAERFTKRQNEQGGTDTIDQQTGQVRIGQPRANTQSTTADMDL